MTKNTFPKQTRTEETLRDYLTFVEQFVRWVQELHDLPPDQRPREGGDQRRIRPTRL